MVGGIEEVARRRRRSKVESASPRMAMAMTIHVDIVSAEERDLLRRGEMVFAPATMGEVGIAPRHAPLMTPRPGEVRLRMEDGEEEAFFASGGILEVQPHLVTVLSDTPPSAPRHRRGRRARSAEKPPSEALADQQSDLDVAKAKELAAAAAQVAAAIRRPEARGLREQKPPAPLSPVRSLRGAPK